MDVLVIGYGKIGRIKAFIWRDLGRRVAVFDVDDTKRRQSVHDGFMLHEEGKAYADLVVDISTPASFHLQSLKWTLEHITPAPRCILIEKPLASDEAELQAMQSLLAAGTPAVVNESYYLSSALGYVAQDIAKCGSRITAIDAELSKNRLEDAANGRFWDEHLGSLGIELPHMIAMVQALGYDIQELQPQGVVVHHATNGRCNEGFTLDLTAAGTQITLRSYLGSFRVAGSATGPNKAVVRSLDIYTAERDYCVQFDPVKGLERYMAQVTVLDRTTGKTKKVLLDDNHLAAHLKKLHTNTADEALDSLLNAGNSLAITELIFALKKAARYQAVPDNLTKVAVVGRPILEEARL